MQQLLHAMAEVLAGGSVGFTLGFIGGGGSILATPMLIYLVGVKNPHIAIGTSALAVSVNALVGLYSHTRRSTVLWREAILFAPFGIIGSFMGARVGQAINGRVLLGFFALLMFVIGALMLKRGNSDHGASLRGAPITVRLPFFGMLCGLLSGFFGIGGGFLIVPALRAATGMAMINAVGTSLVAVALFGLCTALSYSWSGLVDWRLAELFIVGGGVGSFAGVKLAHRANRLSPQALNTTFALLIFLVATYILIASFVNN